jgi:hypothetical protein
VCDLPESTSTTPVYQSCNLSVSYSFGTSATVSYAVQGNYLVCVHNEEYNTSTLDVYNLRRDSDKGVGYRCNAINQGKTSCIQQLGGDFYIKARAAVYSGILKKQVTFNDGYTELIFEDELNAYIKTCQLTNGNCIIPLRVSSDAAGIVYLDQLKLRYDISGSTSEENNFYDVSFTPGVIYQLDTVDLTKHNTTLSLSVDAFNLVAPDPGTKSKNFTLTIALSPGTGDSEILLVQVQNATTSNITQQLTSTQELIDFYESILSQLLQNHNTLLTALQYSQKLTQAIQQLGTFEQQLRGTTNGTNGSSSSIDKQVQILMQSLPQSVTLPLQSTHEFTATYADLTDAVILQNQRDEASRKKIYTLQQSTPITGNADAYELVQFDKTKEEGTFLRIQGNSPFGDGYVVLIIPSSLAGSLSEITFSVQPEIMQQANPAIVRWQTSQFSQGVSLLFKDKVSLPLDNLRAVIVPFTIPEEIPQERSQCGDGVCTVMEINGRIIPLEDKYSCPSDCTTSIPWTTLIIVILLFVFAIAYFGFYHGKYSFQNLTGKGKITKGNQQSLFTTQTDELSLRKYITTSLQRGQQKDVLVKNLLKQGWTQQQIDFILKTLQQR